MQNRGVAMLVQNSTTICIQQHSLDLHRHHQQQEGCQHAASPSITCKPGSNFVVKMRSNNSIDYPPLKFEEHITSCSESSSSSSSSSDDCLDEHTISSAKKRLSWIGDERKRMGPEGDCDWGSPLNWDNSSWGIDTKSWRQRNRPCRGSSIRCEELRKMSKRCISEDSICRDRKTSSSQSETVEIEQVNVKVKCDTLGFGFVIADECPSCVKFVDKQGPAAVAGLKTGDEIVEINGEDVSTMKLQRLQEIFRQKFQAACWNRVRQYHLSVTVRRRVLTTTHSVNQHHLYSPGTSSRTQSRDQQQPQMNLSPCWN